MKLVTYKYEGTVCAGVSDGKLVFPVGADMNAFIVSLGGKLPSPDYMSGDGIALSEVQLLSPIPAPMQDVLCVGQNYRDHVDEAKKALKSKISIPDAAVWFSKRVNYAPGPGEYIDGHFDICNSLDYECELGVIIGKDAFNVLPEDADKYILGYTIINDVSARNIQRERSQFHLGKSLDTFTPMGPWIVTRDEIPFPPALHVQCFVNGELRQDSYTDRLIRSISELLADVTRGMTLKAGTIIATGTPGGVGIAMKPPRFLRHGDVVTCRIEGIGELSNTVR